MTSYYTAKGRIYYEAYYMLRAFIARRLRIRHQSIDDINHL